MSSTLKHTPSHASPPRMPAAAARKDTSPNRYVMQSNFIWSFNSLCVSIAVDRNETVLHHSCDVQVVPVHGTRQELSALTFLDLHSSSWTTDRGEGLASWRTCLPFVCCHAKALMAAIVEAQAWGGVQRAANESPTTAPGVVDLAVAVAVATSTTMAVMLNHCHQPCPRLRLVVHCLLATLSRNQPLLQLACGA